MAYSEKLANDIRQALAYLSEVEEKKMFGSLAFMVNGKMCVTAGPGRMMCRIDPDVHETAIKRKGCKTVVMRGREYEGYIYINEDNLQSKADFNYWIAQALDFNSRISEK